MKNLLSVLTLLAISHSVWAADLAVKITSFHPMVPNNQVAELCGLVTGNAGQSVMLKVVSDPHSNNPGEYTISSGMSGNFCTILGTYQGEVAVSAWASNSSAITSGPAVLSKYK